MLRMDVALVIFTFAIPNFIHIYQDRLDQKSNFRSFCSAVIDG